MKPPGITNNYIHLILLLCAKKPRSNNNTNVRLMRSWFMLPVHTVQVDKGQKYVAAAFQHCLLGADW